jgi:ectoine hydroxylase-related dioxygenase (phytanoyl-CoA dioxygenase family)
VFTLTESQQRLLPSESDVRFYEEHGWFVGPKVFSDEQVDEAVAAIERHHRGERDADLPIRLNQVDDWTEGSSFRVRLNDYVALTNQRLGAFIRNPLLGAIAGRLARTWQIRLWQSTVVYKEPNLNAPDVHIGWHTDRAYWRSCTSTAMLTGWIALQDVDESMGPLMVIDGSHRWPETDAVRAVRYGRTFLGTHPDELMSRIERTGLPITKVPMILKKGQVSFHNCVVLHGCSANVSDRPRIGLTAHLQDGDNAYQRSYDEKGQLHAHNNDSVCRKLPNGDSDFRDLEVCPVLWEAADAPDATPASLGTRT